MCLCPPPVPASELFLQLTVCSSARCGFDHVVQGNRDEAGLQHRVYKILIYVSSIQMTTLKAQCCTSSDSISLLLTLSFTV